jgi:3-ketoacyl-CoA synthase
MPNATALVVNHENITRCFYRGADPSFLLAGALFRLGGAAALISNRRAAATPD